MENKLVIESRQNLEVLMSILADMMSEYSFPEFP